MGNGLNFYFSDLYPFQSVTNTRTQTVPEADDRKALAEEGEAVENTKMTPAQRKKIYIGLGVFAGLIILFGMSK